MYPSPLSFLLALYCNPCIALTLVFRMIVITFLSASIGSLRATTYFFFVVLNIFEAAICLKFTGVFLNISIFQKYFTRFDFFAKMEMNHLANNFVSFKIGFILKLFECIARLGCNFQSYFVSAQFTCSKYKSPCLSKSR